MIELCALERRKHQRRGRRRRRRAALAAGPGSGLSGLADRVEALGGTLRAGEPGRRRERGSPSRCRSAQACPGRDRRASELGARGSPRPRRPLDRCSSASRRPCRATPLLLQPRSVDQWTRPRDDVEHVESRLSRGRSPGRADRGRSLQRIVYGLPGTTPPVPGGNTSVATFPLVLKRAPRNTGAEQPGEMAVSRLDDVRAADGALRSAGVQVNVQRAVERRATRVRASATVVARLAATADVRKSAPTERVIASPFRSRRHRATSGAAEARIRVISAIHRCY